MSAKLLSYPSYKSSKHAWFAEIPGHWVATSVKRHFEIQLGKMLQPQPNSPGDVQVPYLKAQHVQWNDVRIEDPPVMWASRKEIEQFGIAPGDLLVCEGGEGGRSGMLKSVADGYIIQNALHRVRSKSKAKNEYLHYCMQAVSSSGWFEATNNKATIAHFTKEKFGDLTIPLPPLTEQAAIVRYLDHADSRIQSYINAKERLIELLTEQKQALINQAVTRGLDPNVPLKHSGAEWLGEMPAHWKMRTLGQLADSFRTGPFGSMLHQSDYVEGGTPIVNPVHMKDGTFVEDQKITVPKPVAERLSSYRLGLHDLVFARRGELGRCALVRSREVNWLCGTGSIRVRIAYEGMEPEFLIQALQARWVGEYLSLSSVGATMANLNTGILKRVPVLVPPIHEQRDMLEYIRRQSCTITKVIHRARRQIELMNEYRTRLIADVVTGKMDVRGAVADEVEIPTP